LYYGSSLGTYAAFSSSIPVSLSTGGWRNLDDVGLLLPFEDVEREAQAYGADRGRIADRHPGQAAFFISMS
jgi:hypothetical protein